MRRILALAALALLSGSALAAPSGDPSAILDRAGYRWWKLDTAGGWDVTLLDKPHALGAAWCIAERRHVHVEPPGTVGPAQTHLGHMLDGAAPPAPLAIALKPCARAAAADFREAGGAIVEADVAAALTTAFKFAASDGRGKGLTPIDGQDTRVYWDNLDPRHLALLTPPRLIHVREKLDGTVILSFARDMDLADVLELSVTVKDGRADTVHLRDYAAELHGIEQ